MWAVVIFDELEEVEAVPCSWLFPCETKVYWPPFKATSKVTRLIRNRERPSEMWPVYSSRVLKRYDTYEEALRGSKMAEDTSDLAEEEVELGRGSRVIKRKLLDFLEDEVDLHKKKTLPPPPPVPESLVRMCSRSDPPSPASTPCSSPYTGTGSTSSNPVANADLYRTLVSSVVELRHMVVDLSKVIHSQGEMLKSIKEKLTEPHEAEKEQLSNLTLPFPLTNMEEFMQHEERLSSLEYRRAIVSLLSSFGGINIKLLVKKLVDHTLSNGLQRQFNWLGKSFWNSTGETRRKAFRTTQLCCIITTSIRQTKGFQASTEEEVHNAVKMYIRNAKDREGGRSKRPATPVD